MNLVKVENFLFFLTVLFLPTQLGKHFFPNFAFIYSLPIDYFAPTLYFWDLLIFALLAVFLVQKPKINFLALNLVLIFLISLVPSFLNISNLGAGLVRFYQYLVVSFWGVYLASQNFKKISTTIFWGLSIPLIFESILGTLQFIFGHSLWFWIFGERAISLVTPGIATFNYLGQVFLRPYGTFPHPNVLGSFMTVTLPLIWFLKKENQLVAKWVLLMGGMVSFLTFSRAVMLALLAEGLIFLRANIKILTIVLVFILPLLWVRFSSVFNFDSLSILRREDLAILSINYFFKSSIFGVGLNNFINTTALTNLVAGPSRFLQPVHNVLLLSLSETGLIGLVGLILLVGIPIWKLWQKKVNEKNRILLFIWGVVIFLSIFDHYFLTLAQGQRELFLLFGLSMLE